MDYNPFSPEVRKNPYPYYAYLRRHAPVYQIPGVGFWAFSRYDDVMSMVRNPQVFSSATLYTTMTGDLNPFPPNAPPLVGIDPPDHTRLRKLVNRAFTPRRVASLETHMREVVQHMIAQMAAQGEGDLMSDLAIPFPGIVIAELLGVPTERRADFRRWSENIVRALNGTAVPQEEYAEIRQSHTELRAYLEEAIATYRKQPGDNLLSDLVRAEEENQRLTAEEIVSLAALLVLAGNETTTSLLGSTILALFDNPQELAKVRANAALVPQLIEETLRYDAPVHGLIRQTTSEVEVAGTNIPAGTTVMLLYGSANHDERKFPNPERFDITRDTEGHLGFGFGIHFCLGAQLARLEAKVALEMLLQRFPRLARRDGPVTYMDSVLMRGPKTVPLVYES